METAFFQLVMDTRIKRIQQLMLDDGIENKRQLAEKIKRSPATITENLTSDDKLTDSFILRLQDRLGWSANWIRSGRGNKRAIYANVSRENFTPFGEVSESEPEYVQQTGHGNAVGSSNVRTNVNTGAMAKENEDWKLRALLLEMKVELLQMGEGNYEEKRNKLLKLIDNVNT